jgi:uncharacterized protein YbbK (DUF523 family)
MDPPSRYAAARLVSTMPRPILVLSRCLELDACRYNGEMIRAPFVARLLPFVDVKPVCPEVEIGLGVPRDPIRLIGRGAGLRLVQPSSDRDLTGEMVRFVTRFLDALDEADGFVLKARSPSCGIAHTKIYAATLDTDPTDTGAGLFGAAVLARFPHAAVEDEVGLAEPERRHRFLVKLFESARRRCDERGAPGAPRRSPSPGTTALPYPAALRDPIADAPHR